MLINLEHRSNEPELMDDPAVKEKDLQIALSDISRANKLLGGNNITLNAVINMMKASGLNREIVILDLGCGDGEMLRLIADLCRKKNIKVKGIGIDLSDKSLELAKQYSVSYPEIVYYYKNILDIKKSEFGCDIIMCTLTLHHLNKSEIAKLIEKMVSLASLGVIINDLHRNKIAYYLFKLFSFFFIKGHIAKNDGLVSIKRGFKKEELLAYVEDLNVKKSKIHWKWAFRYRWIIKTGLK